VGDGSLLDRHWPLGFCGIYRYLWWIYALEYLGVYIRLKQLIKFELHSNHVNNLIIHFGYVIISGHLW
jgi:hypothetical protein